MRLTLVRTTFGLMCSVCAVCVCVVCEWPNPCWMTPTPPTMMNYDDAPTTSTATPEWANYGWDVHESSEIESKNKYLTFADAAELSSLSAWQHGVECSAEVLLSGTRAHFFYCSHIECIYVYTVRWVSFELIVCIYDANSIHKNDYLTIWSSICLNKYIGSMREIIKNPNKHITYIYIYIYTLYKESPINAVSFAQSRKRCADASIPQRGKLAALGRSLLCFGTSLKETKRTTT